MRATTLQSPDGSRRKGQSWASDPGARRAVFPALGLPLRNPLPRATHSGGGSVRGTICCGSVLLTEAPSVRLRCEAVSLTYTLPRFTAHSCTVCLSRLPGKYRPPALRPGCPRRQAPTKGGQRKASGGESWEPWKQSKRRVTKKHPKGPGRQGDARRGRGRGPGTGEAGKRGAPG